MKRQIYLICMGFSALIAAATQVQAQGRNCGPHDTVTTHLAENYAESRRMIGLAANNAVLELYAADTGSWTILVTGPGGAACIVASGENYEATIEPLANLDPGA